MEKVFYFMRHLPNFSAPYLYPENNWVKEDTVKLPVILKTGIHIVQFKNWAIGSMFEGATGFEANDSGCKVTEKHVSVYYTEESNSSAELFAVPVGTVESIKRISFWGYNVLVENTWNSADMLEALGLPHIFTTFYSPLRTEKAEFLRGKLTANEMKGWWDGLLCWQHVQEIIKREGSGKPCLVIEQKFEEVTTIYDGGKFREPTQAEKAFRLYTELDRLSIP